jgi:signal transduction histidine kinase
MTSERFLERVHPEDRARMEEATQRALIARGPFGLDYRILSKDGQTRILRGNGRVIVDGNGEPERLVGTAQDVTEQRQAEILRADILSIVSHELRTPLASILNFAVILRESRATLGEHSVQRTIEQIVNQARRIDRLLSDLLEIDRLRHGHAVPVRSPTEVAELLCQVADSHRVAGRRIRVRAEPMQANVDPTKIERIVDNLLSNAVKHTPSGTPIALRLERLGDDLLIVVDDDGPGVPDDYKTAVFEIFDRGAKVMSNEPGTGVGLALVARFAALHGGRAWLEDSTTGGASVRVLLPDCVLSEAREPVVLT